MKQLTFAILVLLIASPVLSDPDVLGVYFDPIAGSSISYYPANIPFDVYFAISEPSAGEVYGLEFSYELLVESGDEGKLVRLGSQLPAQAIDVGDNSNIFRGEYIVGLASPIPGDSVVNFVIWTMMILEEIPVYFTLGGISRESISDGLPAYEGGGIIIPLGIEATVGFPSPVIGGGGYPFSACLNSCVVSAKTVSFGAVKALYR